MLFPSVAVAARCIQFIEEGDSSAKPSTARVTSSAARHTRTQDTRLISLSFPVNDTAMSTEQSHSFLSAAVFHKRFVQAAKTFWQHTGDGLSSRRAEFCYELYQKGYLEVRATTAIDGLISSTARSGKGPRRYRKVDANTNVGHTHTELGMEEISLTSLLENRDFFQYIEERYGRNLTLQQAENAKLAVRRRIAGSLVDDLDLPEAIARSAESNTERNVGEFTVDDVYLYPSGMSSIFNTHQTLLAALGSLTSISFG